MMRRSSSLFGASVLMLTLAWLSVGVGTASAQVPYDMSYQGRLTDAGGAPLIGPVNLQMRVYDVISGGSPLYIEDHTAVVVDDVGAFSVRLGAGSTLLGTFNTALFAGVNRYLEVVVDSEVLVPRLVMGSVPYAMQAENATAAQATADAAQTTADAAQVRVSGSCPGGSSIRVVGSDGNVTCQTHTDTTLDEAAVDAFVADNGYSTGAHTVNTDTTLDEAQVDAFVANNEYADAADIAAVQAQIAAVQAYVTDLACGNGTVEAGIETCDDGNTTDDGNGCSASCQRYDVCGNGLVESSYETCDDGAVADGDGCSASCAEEPDWFCTGEPSVCSGRFQACGDGLTVADNVTGLLWERKTTTGDVHDVNNRYTWSSTGTAADGTAYTVFLPGLNGASFAGHADWRLPIISELQSILVGPGVTTVSTNVSPADPAMGTNGTGQATTCAGPPCIDPDFAAVGGPTASLVYWSASANATNPSSAWLAVVFNGNVSNSSLKTFDGFVRAVRTGSCSS